MIVLSLFLAVAAAALELVPGRAISMNTPKDTTIDPCPIKVVVPDNRAGAKTMLVVKSDFTGIHKGGGNKVDYFWRKADASFNSSTDAVTLLSGSKTSAEIAVAAGGTYYLGVRVVECPLCTVLANAYYDLSATLKVDGSYVFDVDTMTNAAYAWTNALPASWNYVYFTITAKGTPHFDFDKGTTSMTDNYDYFYALSNITDIKADTPARMPITPSSSNLVKIDNLDVGSYVLAVNVKTAVGASTDFQFDYSWNAEVTSTYPDGKDQCPGAKCSTSLNCNDCTDEKCNWCETTRTCSTSTVCNATVVTASASCVDIDAECKKLKDCGACANKDGCVWCNSLAGVNIDAGSCSAGKGNNGVDCSSPTATAVTDAAKCAGSQSLLAAAAICVALVAALLF